MDLCMRTHQLDTIWAGKPCLWFETLESTNDYAKEQIKTAGHHGMVILADAQTAGRGRRGRRWESEVGKTLAMSLCLEPKLPAEKVSGLTLVAALAVAEAIRETTGFTAGIKWPNDIVVNGKKICGILTEMTFCGGSYGVVIGIGINVNNEMFPEEIENIAGSLKLETGNEISREQLLTAVLRKFEEFYETYLQTEDLTLLKEDYEKHLVNRDREVMVLDPAQPYQGIARGITACGNLIVECEGPVYKEVGSGEVSVRGLYGYV